ncbi:FecR family protein [Chitinophaga nivalis]|uniref:FecR domain-containing protein n=1 Tax=Chitinophaga nivalis TaxID=2991709 RepID=A0ABT3IGH0_9BACT|nr:FecR domain-containing protein [Chitinophaga nivalis]MCW3467243.1 FecR domain-containing protein [Chitinophaga nivalis]MCW3483065.1 FecR domain-containing protein [Chitinophaga nivalis]
MEMNNSRIEQLIVEELAGVISPEDRDWLHRQIDIDADAHTLYQHKREILHTEALKQVMRNSPAAINIVHRERRRRIRIRRIASWSAAAAILLLAGAYYFSSSFRQPIPPAALANSKHIILQLSDGHSIDLSEAPQQLKLGAMTLQNTQGYLSYQAVSSNTMATLQVPPGKDYRLLLPDGSEITLNAASTLQFPLTFTGNTREVTINGEAYMKIAPNAQQPFMVHLPNSTVEVLGTAFNVNTYDRGHVQVALVEGAVRMKTNDKAQLLQPGEEAIYKEGEGVIVRPFDADYTLSWRKGKHIFNDVPLEEVMKVLPRWFGVQVVIDTARHAAMRFTGVIDRYQPVRISLERLKYTSDFDFYIQDNVVHIR